MAAERSGLISMEQLFREAMLLHRNTVQELIGAKEKIEQLESSRKSLLEKTKSFQQKCIVLKKENKELQDAKEKADSSRPSNDDGCRTCFYLQHSMDSLKEAFNKTLEEKDRTIKMLEERLAEVSKWKYAKTPQKLADKEKSPDTTSEKCMRHLGDHKKCTSPDSTNVRSLRYSQRSQRENVEDVNRAATNDVKTSQGMRKSENSSGGPAAVIPANVTDKYISPITRKRLLTLAKEKKKNRYQETATTEVNTNLEKRDVNSLENSQKSCKKFIESKEGDQLSAEKDDKNSYGFRPETDRTCTKRQLSSESDGSFLSEQDYEDGDTHRTRKLRKKDLLRPNIIVPETMAVDYFVDSDEENNSDLENESPVKNLNYLKPGQERYPILQRGDNFNIGPPTASSTQIVQPVSRNSFINEKKLCKIPDKNSDKKNVNVPLSTFDPDITVLETSDKNNTVIENIAKDGGHGKLSIDTTRTCLGEEEKLSPVFLGSKNLQKAVGTPGSPCLFEEENQMADEIDAEKSLDEDSQSPFLLRQPLSTGQGSNIQDEKLLDDDNSQSPSLLHGTRSNSTRLTRPSSQPKVGKCFRKSTRGHKPSEKDLRQTTLTQVFDESLDNSGVIKAGDLHNLSKRNEKIGAQFKKPIMETARKKYTFDSVKKASQTPTKVIGNSSPADLDETIAPQPSCKFVKGNNLPSCDHNASLDPAVRLTLDFPDSVVTENVEQLKKNGSKLKLNANESRTVEEESQVMPCSSKSVKFVGKPKISTSLEVPEDTLQNEDVDQGESDLEEEEEVTVCPDVSLHSSFDRVPKVKGPDYAYVDVVRKKDERRKLNAFFCQECEDYFKSIGLPAEERTNRMQDCSRHRARYVPPSTPEHFWSIGFPDTPECEERGYILKESPKAPSRFRRKKRLEKRFKTTNEEKNGDNETDVKGEEDLNTSELIFEL